MLFLVLVSALAIVASANDENEPKKYNGMDVAFKSPAELIRLRGFHVTEHRVLTPDGWLLQVLHLKHPDLEPFKRKRPVLFTHGFLASATIFLTNSHGISKIPIDHRCSKVPFLEALKKWQFEDFQFVNGPMLLANRGFDVYLVSLRGTEFSSHTKLAPSDSKYWSFTLDDFALIDVPTVIEFIRQKSGVNKIGFVGHSQATFAIFGLLSRKPWYANRIEPVVAIAPIAHLEHISSIATPLMKSKLLNEFAVDGPMPPLAKELRKDLVSICGKDEFHKLTCTYLESMAARNSKNWPKGFFSQVPYSSSIKVAQQLQQIFQAKRPQMFDFGKKKNLVRYGKETPPGYHLERILSKSLCLISSKADAISTPEDVAELKQKLKNANITLYRDVFIDRDDINHNDFIFDREAAKMVFRPVLQVFEEFEIKSGSCARNPEQPPNDKASTISEEPNDNLIEITGFDLTSI